MVLCLQWQYAIIDWANLDTLGHVKITLAFGTGFFVDFKNNSTFGDGVCRTDRQAIAA